MADMLYAFEIWVLVSMFAGWCLCRAAIRLRGSSPTLAEILRAEQAFLDQMRSVQSFQPQKCERRDRRELAAALECSREGQYRESFERPTKGGERDARTSSGDPRINNPITSPGKFNMFAEAPRRQ